MSRQASTASPQTGQKWISTNPQAQVRAHAATLSQALVKLAGTNDHLVLRPDRHLAYTGDPVDYLYRPSVDVFYAFYHSLGTSWPRPGIAVVLTGMGSDGAQGLLQLRQSGWHTITQDQASCVAHGMSKAAADLRAASRVLPLAPIPEAILDHLRHLQLAGVRSSAASTCDSQS